MFLTLKKLQFKLRVSTIKQFSTTFLHQPIYSITFNNIADNNGARKEKLRLGRGPGSGLGKTGGRGMKGMKSRTGGRVNPNMEGGQTNFMKRIPKYGRKSSGIRFRPEYINISKIIYFVNKGIISPTKSITIRDLFEAGALSKVKNGVKLLGGGCGALAKIPPLNLEVSSASQQAIDAIKKNGGTVTCVYRSPLTLKYHIKPYKFYKAIIDPLPTFKKTKKLLALEEKGAK
jgi:large subunit ribosomal protein L15